MEVDVASTEVLDGTPDLANYWKRVVPIVILLTCCFFLPAWLQGKAYVASDILKWNYPFRASGLYRTQDPFLENEGDLQDVSLMFYPSESLAEREWRSGRIPLWDPRIGTGYPIHATNWSSSLFPVRALCSLLGGVAGRSAEQFLCFLCSGVSMGLFLTLLGSSWRATALGSAAWTFGGFSIALFEISGFGWSNAVVPLCLSCVLLIGRAKKWAVPLLGMAFGLLILAGSLQNSFFYGLLLAGYSLSILKPSRLGWAAFGLLLGCLVGLPTLWGQLEMVVQSGRLDALPHDFRTALSLQEVSTAVYPFQFGGPWDSFYLGGQGYSGVNNLRERCLYMGLLSPFLVCFGVRERRYRFWVCLLGLTLLYSLGNWFTVLVQALVPPLKNLVLTRVLQITQIGVVVLAVVGWDQLTGRDLPSQKRKQVMVVWSSLAVIASLPFLWNVVQASSDPNWIQQWSTHLVKPAYFEGPKSFGQIMTERLSSHFVLLNPVLWLPMFAVVGMSWAWWTRRLNLLLSMALVDLVLYALLMNVAQPVKEIYPELPAFQSLSGYRQAFPSKEPVLRSAGWKRMAHANSLSYYGFCDVAAYQSLLLADYRTLMQSFNAPEFSPLLVGLHDPVRYSPGIADLLGVGFHYSDPAQKIAAPFGSSETQSAPPAAWNTVPWTSAKRAYLVGAARQAHPTDVLQWILEPNFDPRQSVFLGNEQIQAGKPESMQGEPGETGQIAWERYDTQSLALVCTAPKRAWLVLNEAYFQGWEATVDDRPVPILKADYAFRAVELEAGRHKVAMQYRPKCITLGVPIALMSTLLLMVVAWALRR